MSIGSDLCPAWSVMAHPGVAKTLEGDRVSAMTGCPADADLEELGRGILEGFDHRILAIRADLCAPFHAEAAKLESEILLIYKMTALCVRREEDIERVAFKWGEMVTICKGSLQRLGKLKQDHPNCSAGLYYDHVSEIMSKCQRLQEMHT